MTAAKLTLILGGANSGKSAYAEALVLQAAQRPAYIATAQAFDDEMRAKIARHQVARGPEWTTFEAPLDPASALGKVGLADAVLIDCATLWLSNLLIAEAVDGDHEERLFAAIEDCPAPVVIVSNEVGAGLVPETAMGRRFRSLQGGFNQRAAARADRVIAVMAGLPLALKGDLP